MTGAPSRPRAAEPVAVVGLSCRFPGAPDADAFWRLLADGGDAIGEVPPDRWDADAYRDADPAAPGAMTSRWGGFIDGIDRFDPGFFGISPGEAASMDPQHRLLLEVTWETLERAGIVPARLAGSETGVFVGIGTDDYASVGFDTVDKLTAYYVTGNAMSIAVNRLSHLLDLRGPSLALDTGCSSSLVAVHLACASLRSGESRLALAGGVNVILSPKPAIALSRTWMMAADGRCKSFDAAADGYVRGEGCGMVALKLLADAERDGDPVLAVIRGSAMNQNGRGDALIAPNAAAQRTVVERALAAAGVTPGQVDLIEAHGVGTPLADVVEAQALIAVFGPGRLAGQPCMLGSVKTNIGHLEMAAGVAGLIKTVLALEHEAIPPHLHLRELNPASGLAGGPFTLPTAVQPWPRGDRERLAGVNSFGLGGVNVHLVVAESPLRPTPRTAVVTDPLMLSARDGTALRELAWRYATVLDRPDAPDFAAVCATAAQCRTHFGRRLAVVAANAATAAGRLRSWLARVEDPAVFSTERDTDGSSLAERFVRGEDPEPGGGIPLRRVVLPTYPFQRRRCWVEEPAAEEPDLVRRVRATNPARRPDVLAAEVSRLAAEVIGLDAAAPVDPRQGFFALGMTSLMAVEFGDRLRRLLGSAAEVSTTVVFEHASVAALTDHLAGLLAGPEAVPGGPGRGGPVPAGTVSGAPRPLDRRANRSEPVAVVGMGCRFPGGGGNPEAFWRMLHAGVDAVGEVPADRWDVEALYDPDPDAPGRMSTRSGHFLADIDQFDPAFFGISPREAVSLDPQQRLLLEVAWEALEHAGQVPDRLSGTRTGVFVGLISNEYLQLQVKRNDPAAIDAYYGTGGIGSAVAGRLSYLLGLQGPSLVVDTACSSSLVAVHLAVQSLRSGESDLALAGGVNLIIAPESSTFLSKARALSPDGRCKTFSAAADGYGRGEGCGVVVLKRLSDAERDGDPVLAVLRGSAVNHDGPSGGLTVPNGSAQAALIRTALADAGMAGSDVDYVEAHGTGTPLGDPIELNALGTALGSGGRTRRVLVGSVKTNVGHLEAAAGVAGLIKVVLALGRETVPPHLHFAAPSRHVDWDALGLDVPVAATPWPRGDRPRVAGLSAFGMSGTNAHVVVAEAPASQAATEATAAQAAPGTVRPDAEPAAVLALSARSGPALRELAGRWIDRLAAAEAAGFAAACAAAAARRSVFEHRIAVVAPDAATAAELLRGWLRGEGHSAVHHGVIPAGHRPTVAWLFTGQGSQYPGMAGTLHRTEPVFAAALQRCAELLGAPLRDLLQKADADTLNRTGTTQPVLFAVEWALAQLWLARGVEPDVVLGHSVGELVAATVAGVMSLEDGLDLVAARGRLMQQLPAGGAMTAVAAAPADVTPHLTGDVVIAAHNSPAETVLSGPAGAVEQVAGRLRAAGFRTTALHVSHAFHSPLMEPMLPDFLAVTRRIHHHPPQRTLVSNVTGGPVDAVSAAHWAEHVVSPVLFADAVTAVRDCAVLQEIGPHPVLLAAAQRTLPDGDRLLLPTLRRGRDDRHQFLTAVAALFVHGVPLRWPDAPMPTVPLPTYPFQRRRYWVGPPRSTEAELNGWLYEPTWQPREGTSTGDLAGDWLVLADRGGVGEAATESLRAAGGRCRVLHADDPEPLRQVLAGAGTLRGVLHLRSLDLDPAVPDAQQSSCGSLLELVQVLASGVAAGAPRIWVATRGAQPVGGTIAPHQAPIWGLGTVVGLEHPALWGGLIDLDPAGTEPAGALLDAIRSAAGEDRIALRAGRRYVARLARADRPAAGSTGIRSDATYLVTGGLGALGLRVARWLADRGARHLVLVGRGDGSDAAQAAVRELDAEVRQLRADIGSAAGVDRVLAAVADLPPLRGVFHAAGVLDDGVLTQQHWDRFERVLRPKAAGAWHLHTATRHLPLDQFVLFSSVASVLGAPGQANYAAANAYLDALAHYRRACGLPALSVNWGAWEGGGMAAGLADRDQRRWFGRGIGLIPPDRGIRALDRAIRLGVPQLGVLPVDWDRYAAEYPVGGNKRLLAELVQRKTAESRLREHFAAIPASRRQEALVSWVSSVVAQVLMIDGEPLDPALGLFDLGLDSLMALEVRNRLAAALETELPATLLFEHPSIEAVTVYLRTDVLADRPEVGSTPPEPPADDGLESLLDDLDRLSDEEIELRLTGQPAGKEHPR